MMLLNSPFTLLLLSMLNNCKATITVDFSDDFQTCENGYPLPEIEFSQLEVLPEEDGSLTINGSFKFNLDYSSPTRLNMYTESFERGSWKPGMLSRDVRDICINLPMPNEPWFPFTRFWNQKSCPFRAGHEEFFDNINLGNYAALLNIPPSFIGEWRLYYEITTTRQGKRVMECIMVPCTISEV